MPETQQPPDPMVAPLLNERRGYLNTGQKDRAKMVEDRLAELGYDTDGNPSKSAAEQRKAASSSTGDQPQGRTSKAAGSGASTAEGDKSK